MAQFDVYENEAPESREVIPFLLDLQHDLHSNLSTRTVVPLVRVFSATEVPRYLCPKFRIDDKDVFMSTSEMAGYPAADLRTRVTSLSDRRPEILAAVDFLLTGF